MTTNTQPRSGSGFSRGGSAQARPFRGNNNSSSSQPRSFTGGGSQYSESSQSRSGGRPSYGTPRSSGFSNGDRPAFGGQRSSGFSTRQSFGGRPSFGGGGSRFGGGRSGGRGGFKSDRIDESRFINKATPQTEEAVHVAKHTFADFNVHPLLAKNLIAKGFVQPSPIQDLAIPVALEGKDVVGVANTGTGKTAAFLIPIINSLVANNKPKAMVLTPTRELAQQIEVEFRALTAGMRLWSVAVGSHHGRPKGKPARSNGPEALSEWAEISRMNLLEVLCAEFGPLPIKPPDDRLKPYHSDLWLLAGLITVADWIGSNEIWFSPEEESLPNASRQQARAALRQIRWPGGKLRHTTFPAA